MKYGMRAHACMGKLESIKISGGSKMSCIMLDGGGQGRAPMKLPSLKRYKDSQTKTQH